MNKKIFLFLYLLILLIIFFYSRFSKTQLVTPKIKDYLWPIRSIDTVKYSRDLSKEKINDSSFDQIIALQVGNIAQTGANYIALGTPYDSEFIPFLAHWVKAARANKLRVWFRGNFAGWEQWFNYPKIDRATHLKLTEDFILNNPDLFEDGDIYTPCSECENGGSGDPRTTGDIFGYRQFLIQEYEVSRASFAKIKKNVNTGFFSMNGDVAKLIMDKQTTKALGGILVVDHYVATPKQLVTDIQNLIRSSGGKVVLGEFGTPIKGITADMDEDEQADWLKKVLEQLPFQSDLIGLNYWVSVGGSTQLWTEDNQPREAVEVLRQFYSALR